MIQHAHWHIPRRDRSTVVVILDLDVTVGGLIGHKHGPVARDFELSLSRFVLPDCRWMRRRKARRIQSAGPGEHWCGITGGDELSLERHVAEERAIEEARPVIVEFLCDQSL